MKGARVGEHKIPVDLTTPVDDPDTFFGGSQPQAASESAPLKMFSGTAGVGVTIRNGTFNVPIRLKGRWRCITKTRCRNS
jgi:hypothetical protein